MKVKQALSVFLLLFPLFVSAQENKGVIEGRVYNAKNNEPVPFATVVIWNTTTGAITDFEGNFRFTGIQPGFVEVRVSSVGYQTYISESLQVTNANKVFLEVALEETSVALEEVVVRASPFRKREESPVSLRIIGLDEIEKNPGGNRDISRVIQSFPGVATTPAFRNDVIVRGGGPNENRFYLDDVEIPYLNHFSTQGASGGPVGIINVDFIREVNFYSGAFPAGKGNALSSVLELKQKDGNLDKMKYRATIGASDLALTLDGPIGEKSGLIFSVRRSYLQLLFQALELPFLPTYNDLQFKYQTRINEKNEFTVVGLGALDDFSLNLEANETEEQQYILDYLPVNEQYSYTFGMVWKHFRDAGFDTWVLSRNYLNNTQYKYQGNNEVDSLLLLDYASGEGEIKFRYERNDQPDNGFKFNYGVGYDHVHYTNDTYRKIFLGDQAVELDYSSDLRINKWYAFGQVSRDLLGSRLVLSLGARMDANDYASSMSNMLEQLSPRFSASYRFRSNFFLNANLGRYYQLPPYTSLGYRNLAGDLVNRDNEITHIGSTHYVGGIEWLPTEQSQITLEGFYKTYDQYPFSVADSVPLSSKSADYGVFGDEEIRSIAEGRAYGLELLGRHKDLAGFNVVFSYTLVFSEFKGNEEGYIPTAWDNRHLLNLTATRSFKKNWDVGFKWRLVGGAPYTPFDLNRSAIKEAWDLQGLAYLDYSRYNQERLQAFHQLDLRVDKSYFFDKWTLMLYVDVQNAYNFKARGQDFVLRERDANGDPLTDPTDEDRYVLKRLVNESGTVLPTVGVIVEF